MKKTTKEELEVTFQHIVEDLVRHYNLDDDHEPYIHMQTQMYGCNGQFFPKQNRIAISTVGGYWIANTVAHELAHWMQYLQQGATYCNSMLENSSKAYRQAHKDAAKNHYKLQHEILEHMDRWAHTDHIKHLVFCDIG